MREEPLLLAILAVVAMLLFVIHRLRGSGVGSAPDRGHGTDGGSSHVTYIGDGCDGGNGGGGDGGGGD